MLSRQVTTLIFLKEQGTTCKSQCPIHVKSICDIQFLPPISNWKNYVGFLFEINPKGSFILSESDIANKGVTACSAYYTIYGAFTLRENETEAKTDTEPNGNPCRHLSQCSMNTYTSHLHTILYTTHCYLSRYRFRCRAVETHHYT